MNSNNLPTWLIDEMATYLYSNNMIFKNKDHNGVIHVPVMLYPSPVNKMNYNS